MNGKGRFRDQEGKETIGVFKDGEEI
jgi:hypothetical protein